jgi:DNA-binding beta-propeller fold protein YncE
LSSGARPGRGIGAALIALAGLFLALGAATASGAQPEELIKFPGDGLAGSAGGRMQIPKGIAASPLSGDVYVTDVVNERIDEFSAWGTFVRAWGWDVVEEGPDNTGTGFEICEAEEDVCKKGSQGTGAGQFGSGQAGGIAVDPETGDLYATDMGINHRVQKFSASGEFLLMFGGEVNKTSGADVCTKADIEGGDVCGAGVSGSGDGEFLAQAFGSYLALSPDGQTVYVGDKDRIQEFGPGGAFKGQIRFEDLHAEEEDFPESGFVLGLAADPVSGDLYVIAGTSSDLSSAIASAFRIDPASGEILGTLSAPTLGMPTSVATDSAGSVYVVNRGNFRGEILEFDSDGNKLIPSAEEEAIFKAEAEAESKEEPFEHFVRFGEPPIGASFSEEIQLTGIATDSGCESESDDLYATYSRQGGGEISALAYVNSFGPPPQNALKCPPPPPEAPEIAAQYASAVGTSSAKLRADINPHYDTSTTYYLEYGTGKCSEEGCEAQKPLPPGTQLSAKIANAAIRSGAIAIGGLEEATTYHYRFVAVNSVGTVKGEGGEVGSDGAEGSFTTFPAPGSPKEDCPNQAFRSGFAARLTDCRAYELVSPAKRSPAGDVVSGLTGLGYPAELNQSSSDGEKLAYSSEFAFGDAVGGPITNEYIATRHGEEGWSTHAISPPRESKPINDNALIKKDIEEKAFTADLCSSWLMHDTDPVLGEGGIEGFPNVYRRDNCEPGADTYRGITSVQPPDTFAGFYWPEVQGVSADGARTVFRANAKLTADAPDLGPYGGSDAQLYEWSEGAIRFICRLPNGSPLEAPCSAGLRNGSSNEGRENQVENAVSEDGRRIYWSASNDSEGQLYLRENADAEQSPISAGKCTEPETKACTYKVSNEAAQFWTAAADGSAALFTEGNKLREFDAASKKAKTLAESVAGVAGASEDLSLIYFVSRRELGGEGAEGEPNLYLREEGGTKLVGTLAGEDLHQSVYLALNPASEIPIGHGARTSADGEHLVFASTASLSGYDNRDAESGEPDAEVFLYDAGATGPVCISCNPSGARPVGRVPVTTAGASWVAALIPTAETQLYAPQIITEDGNRVFFESFDSLLARDNNGKEDVYEWERAGSAEACEELGADLYVPASGGCLSLISSGEALQDSVFVDMSVENGARDVFFKTGQSLLGEDPGLIDIYDAREGGGLPEEETKKPCELGACPSPSAPPDDPTPSSSSFEGPEEAKPKPHCPKGKHRVNGKCVKKKKHKHKKPKQRSAKAGRR